MNDLLISWAIELMKLVFYVSAVAIGSGWITAALTQLLKWKIIAIPAEKYPTVVAAIISFLVAVPAVYLTGIIVISGWYGYLVLAIASLFVAVQSYDIVKAAILQLKGKK